MINLNKIDKSLLDSVRSMESKSSEINCLVFSDYKNIFSLEFYNNFKIIQKFPFINAFSIVATPKTIINLTNNKSVKYISSQTKVSTMINVSKKIMGTDYFYNQGIYGDNITIAVIDTGIKPHLDFTMPTNRIIKFIDLVNYNILPYDDNGHGTFVAGIAGGNGIVSNYKYSGIAPKCNILSIKTLDENGETGAVKILEAMQWVYDNKERYNIAVVCMSFGSEPIGRNDPLKVGAEALWSKGIVVVAAAGNSGPSEGSIKSPGISTKIITVGGLDDHRNVKDEFNKNKFTIADFSSRGPAYNFYKPDLVTPAVDIISLSIGDKFYTKMSGTSVATPMVAGLCALIKEKYNKFTPDHIKSYILRNCNPIINNRNFEGFGYPNFEIY